MVQCSFSISSFVFIIAIYGVICKEKCDEECLSVQECAMFSAFNTEQQQMWLEKYSCDEHPEPNETADLLVCCPENIWGISNTTPVSDDKRNTGKEISKDSNQNVLPPESLDRNLDDFADKSNESVGGAYGPTAQNPYFLPGPKPNDNNAGGATTGLSQCAISRLPPDPNSGCCGIEASGSEKKALIRNQDTQPRPKNNNRPFRWIPNNMQRSFFPSWTAFHDDEDEDEDEDEDKKDEHGRKIRQAPVSVGSRIAGGKETDLKQFPWTVLLKTTFKYPNKESSFSCGGSLISSKFVLTAGHCVYDPDGVVKSVEVTLAEYDKRTFPRDCKFMLSQGEVCVDNVVIYAEHFTIHPEYNDEQLLNDIALIRLRGEAPYTDYIRPICLPTVDVDTPDLSNLKLTAVGWGRNGLYKSDVKQSTVVNLVPQNECKKSYPNLTRRQLCAAGYSGEDTCKGDSGGPLMVTYKGKYQISGVVSGKRSDAPCGTSVPSLYTNVYQHVPWIRSVIYRSM